MLTADVARTLVRLFDAFQFIFIFSPFRSLRAYTAKPENETEINSRRSKMTKTNKNDENKNETFLKVALASANMTGTLQNSSYEYFRDMYSIEGEKVLFLFQQNPTDGASEASPSESPRQEKRAEKPDFTAQISQNRQRKNTYSFTVFHQ